VIFARARATETPREARQAAEFARLEIWRRRQILLQPFERSPRFISSLIPPGAIFGEHPADQALKIAGEIGRVFGERRLLTE
jgi:hypothetical protein